MKKREANFTILFRHWINANPFKHTIVFELKQTTTNSIRFDSVQDHQIDALMASKWGNKGLLYKIPDDSRGIKPYDMVYLYNVPAFIVIKYPKCFVFIDVDTFVLEKKRSKRKSLTKERAIEIAWKSIKAT